MEFWSKCSKSTGALRAQVALGADDTDRRRNTRTVSIRCSLRDRQCHYHRIRISWTSNNGRPMTRRRYLSGTSLALVALLASAGCGTGQADPFGSDDIVGVWECECDSSGTITFAEDGSVELSDLTSDVFRPAIGGRANELPSGELLDGTGTWMINQKNKPAGYGEMWVFITSGELSAVGGFQVLVEGGGDERKVFITDPDKVEKTYFSMAVE